MTGFGFFHEPRVHGQAKALTSSTAGPLGESIGARRDEGAPLRVSFLVGAGFALIYALIQYYPPLAALAILALLPCVLFRVDERQRGIAQAPLTFASLMLTQKIFATRIIGQTGYFFGAFPAPWLPLFLGVCLYYIPAGASRSRNLLLGLAATVLLTGLLPGTAFLAVLATMQYILFPAVAIVLALDFFAPEAQRATGGV